METIKKGASTKQKSENVQTAESKKATPTVKKAAILKKVVQEEKEEVKQQTQKMITNFKPTAEERIKNAEKFKILTSKYDHLKAKKEEMEKFKISSDGTKERIYFENSEGFKLEVSNSNIVNNMLQLAENTLNEIVNKTEKEVQEFVI